ncbi:MAG TPA: EamA family transporter [Parafilimonas sp.]|nr:EamA family transporter [Parafilimonas sp.]
MSNNRIKILLAFAAIYFVWGSTYVVLRFGIKTIPPFLFSAARFFIAGILLLSYCLLKRKPLPDRRSFINNSICGVLMLGGGTVSVAWAEQYVPSSTAAIMVTFLPFLFVLCDKSQWNYYFSNKIIIIGLLVGFIGVVLLTNFSNTDTTGLNIPGHAALGIVAILAGEVGWTTGSLISKYKTSNASLLMNASIQLLATSTVCLVISFAGGEWETFSIAQVSPQSIIALVYLVFMGSLIAYLSYIYLLSVLPAVEVSTHVYVNPVVAVLLGALLANEPVNLTVISSLILILFGVLLVNMPKYYAPKKS